MTLDDFVKQWERLQKVTKLVKGMNDTQSDNVAFQEFYSDLREDIRSRDRQFMFLFPDYNPNAQNAAVRKSLILGKAAGYYKGLGDSALDYSNINLEGILDEAKSRLGDDLLTFVASIEPRTDEPASFVSMVKDYREAMKPLSKDNPDPERIKREMKVFIDGKVGTNPDRHATIVANAIKELYENPEFAAVSYAINIVEPKQDSLKATIDTSNNWKTYIAGNIVEFKKGEKIDFYLGLYNKIKD